MASLGKVMRRGKALFLAYDQGIEHGPTDFDSRNVDPLFILDIARKGRFTGVVFHKGIAQKYHREIKDSRVPLVVKLNGKTSLVKGEPLSRQLCSVRDAVKLGAVAVGYTIYIGSEFESLMFQEFEKLKSEADKLGIPTIVWMYPRGSGVKGKSKKKLMAYAARAALELGADMVKLQYHGNPSDLSWAVRSAGRTKVVVAGGAKRNLRVLERQVKEISSSGAVGLAIGRNVWQASDPLLVASKLRELLWL